MIGVSSEVDLTNTIISKILLCQDNGDPGGIRTHIIGVRGRPPKPLEDGAILKQDSTLPARYLCFQPTQPAAGNVPDPPKVDPSYELRSHSQTPLPVAEPAQIGLQMALAIATFTSLLYNCFRTRLISRYQ